MTVLLKEKKGLNFALTSFIIGLVGFIGALVSVYIVLKLSQHPLLTDSTIEMTMEERKMAGSQTLRFVKWSYLFFIPVYLASLVACVLSFIKKENSPLKGFMVVIHVLLLISIILMSIN